LVFVSRPGYDPNPFVVGIAMMPIKHCSHRKINRSIIELCADYIRLALQSSRLSLWQVLNMLPSLPNKMSFAPAIINYPV
jgi:hypothetical protein